MQADLGRHPLTSEVLNCSFGAVDVGLPYQMHLTIRYKIVTDCSLPTGKACRSTSRFWIFGRRDIFKASKCMQPIEISLHLTFQPVSS